jgi:hypothetical protein
MAAVLAISGFTAAALPASAASAASPAAASAWYKVWLTAESGGGCATFAADENLAPIVSEPCTSGNWWYYRDLSRSTEDYQYGDKLEFVDQSKSFALGFSGGLFKLEIPNDDTTYLVVGEIYYPWNLFLNQAGTRYIAPNGAGDDVKVLTAASIPPDGWAVCKVDTPYC